MKPGNEKSVSAHLHGAINQPRPRWRRRKMGRVAGTHNTRREERRIHRQALRHQGSRGHSSQVLLEPEVVGGGGEKRKRRRKGVALLLDRRRSQQHPLLDIWLQGMLPSLFIRVIVTDELESYACLVFIVRISRTCCLNLHSPWLPGCLA
ncbi:hypothetical protein E2C01_004157 [Portunus trituberculatus]|uniref:Uncharacterized protein n=1 Tax=Portunus trituberculatus TaxID=210409 RepID=A0A5B7CRN3_PORTR|nr:hypothetical protein [Portunus trituberculatus]